MTAIRPNPEPGSTLQIAHRTPDRRPMAGVATACRIAGERFGEILDLRGLEHSPCGLTAICRKPIEPGAILSIGFSHPEYIAKRGTVMQCMPYGEGYRVSIEIDARLVV